MKKCSVCKQQKDNSLFRHARSKCIQCERETAKAWYYSHKNIEPRECRVCHKVSTNFQTGKAQCRTCLARKRRDYNLSKATGISQGMIALWKAGWSYNDACRMVKNNRDYKQ